MKDLNSKIQEWKKEYGKIYKTVVDGEDFIWRRLKRKEYSEVMSKTYDELEDPEARVAERQFDIVNMVTLYPENIKELTENSAGLSISISDEVLSRSGFNIDKTEEL